jgi:RimJ/RimL family protein N-acetyltransferase
MKIKFEKINSDHKTRIFEWLEEPHMREFWDNSQEHKDDIINFINGRVQPSHYFDGIFTYWIGSLNEQPFCFILTAAVKPREAYPQIWRENISKSGTTYSLDFGIGNKKFLGQGLAAPTLEAFTDFFQAKIDPKADTFFIDPDVNNPRAEHVYEKAGFVCVGNFKSAKKYWDFTGEATLLMVKKLKPRA